MNNSTATKMNEELGRRCKLLAGFMGVDDFTSRGIYFRGVSDCRYLMLEAIQEMFPDMPYPETGRPTVKGLVEGNTIRPTAALKEQIEDLKAEIFTRVQAYKELEAERDSLREALQSIAESSREMTTNAIAGAALQTKKPETDDLL